MESVPENVGKEKVETFYNQFSEHQVKLGVNIRHRTIFRNLKQSGLQRDSSVLEIGCGIGTVSGLILRYLKNGKYIGVDISAESIEIARSNLSGYKNAEFRVGDMSTISNPYKFDFVVLPDVLEHIPIENHSRLFQVINDCSSKDAVVLINIPEPHCLDWVRKVYPEKLQIIDQSLSIKDLLNNSYAAGFALYSVKPYSLQYTEPDYVSIILKKKIGTRQYLLKSSARRAFNNFCSHFY